MTMDAHIAFSRPIVRASSNAGPQHYPLPEELSPGYIGEVVAGDRTLRIAAVKRYGPNGTDVEPIDPVIELEPGTFACAPGGSEIGVYDVERVLVNRYVITGVEDERRWTLATPGSVGCPMHGFFLVHPVWLPGKEKIMKTVVLCLEPSCTWSTVRIPERTS